MFWFLTFPLANQIKTCVAIQKLISLKFRYSTCLILSNGQFYIPKIPNIQIQKPEKENCGFLQLPLLVHLQCAFTLLCVDLQTFFPMVKACMFLALQGHIWVTTVHFMNCIEFALARTTITPWKLGLSKPTHIFCSFKHVKNTN